MKGRFGIKRDRWIAGVVAVFGLSLTGCSLFKMPHQLSDMSRKLSEIDSRLVRLEEVSCELSAVNASLSRLNDMLLSGGSLLAVSLSLVPGEYRVRFAFSEHAPSSKEGVRIAEEWGRIYAGVLRASQEDSGAREVQIRSMQRFVSKLKSAKKELGMVKTVENWLPDLRVGQAVPKLGPLWSTQPNLFGRFVTAYMQSLYGEAESVRVRFTIKNALATVKGIEGVYYDVEKGGKRTASTGFELRLVPGKEVPPVPLLGVLHGSELKIPVRQSFLVRGKEGGEGRVFAHHEFEVKLRLELDSLDGVCWVGSVRSCDVQLARIRAMQR